SDAAMPPSAITVCALPSKLLLMTPVDRPSWLQPIAARNPAPPAPITTTSCSKVWISETSISVPGVEVSDHAHGDHAHVEIGEGDPEQADHRELHVPLVEPGRELPQRELRRVLA